MKRYIAGIGLCCALAACNESYPGLYAPVYDADNPNPEMTADSIPVTLSLTDPAYALVTGKRGQGSFGFWDDEEERAKWMAAEFGVYAFLTRNHVYDGPSDLTADETSTGGGAPLCLINDRKARISAACELIWADGEPPYYSAVYPEHKYNFFLYYKGDAEEYAPEQRTQGSITKFFRIDGTQDLMSAYARPGTEDAERLSDNDETKYLMNHAGDLVYSTKSARLHVEPHLRVKHELARLNFLVQAYDTLKQQGREIRIQSVALVIPTRAQFTVAADWAGVSHDWTDETNAPRTGISWEAECDTVYVPNENTPTEFGATLKRENATFDPEPGVSDPEEEPVKIGKPLLVPPIDQLGVIIYYRFLTANPEDKIPSGSIFIANYSNLRLESGFQAGKEHDVLLKVYGPRKIELAVDGKGLGWISGGDITVGEEEEDTN
ncbi:hypothetical protein [Paraprevotella xylaniphila]